jgi:hypothetical protein
MSTFEKVKEDTTREATDHKFGYCPECDGTDMCSSYQKGSNTVSRGRTGLL